MLSCWAADPDKRPTFHDLTRLVAHNFARDHKPHLAVTRDPHTGKIQLEYAASAIGIPGV